MSPQSQEKLLCIINLVKYPYHCLFPSVACLEWVEGTTKGKVQIGKDRRVASREDLNSMEHTLGYEDRNPPPHTSWLSPLPWKPLPPLRLATPAPWSQGGPVT